MLVQAHSWPKHSFVFFDRQQRVAIGDSLPIASKDDKSYEGTRDKTFFLIMQDQKSYAATIM